MGQRTDQESSLQPQPKDVLNEILRQGARQMLAAAIDNEVADYIAAHADQRDDDGQRLLVRNGHLPQRSIQTGLGPIEVRQPRVNDRRTDAQGHRIRFTSKILPPYLRRTKSIDELIPWLYLRGISTGDFSQALEALLGPQAKGLSPAGVRDELRDPQQFPSQGRTLDAHGDRIGVAEPHAASLAAANGVGQAQPETLLKTIRPVAMVPDTILQHNLGDL